MAEKQGHAGLRWLPFIGGCAAIWILSDMPRPPVPDAMSFPHADKVLHAIGYAGLCTLAVIGATPSRLVLAFMLTLAWGALDELHQGFVPGRERSWLDLLADGAGAAAVTGLARARRGAGVSPRGGVSDQPS